MEKQLSIVNCDYKCYLIGSMENPAKLDGGVGWRQRLTPELNKRNIYTFDPTREEISKVGMPTEEFMGKLTGWQRSGNWELFVDNMRKIWRGTDLLNEKNQSIHIFGDVDYVEHSNFLIWNYDRGDKPGGSVVELAIAWYRGIPVYLITDMLKTEINKSILYFILDSGHGRGQIFKAHEELLEFLDEEYHLTKTK